MLENLDSLPDNEPYLWADYLEIWATISIDKCFSRGELYSICRAQPKPKSRAFSDEKWQLAITFIDTRIVLYGADYPYYLSDDRDTIHIRHNTPNSFTENEKLYIALLFCSNVKYIAYKKRHLLTGSFEKISLPIFKSLMPQGSTITPCWASAGNSGVYTGLLYDKLVKIASDIRCTPNFSPADFKPGDRGDGGIDMLAWYDMADRRPSMPIAFAQCGCSKDEWVAKQLEASPTKMIRMLPVIHPWANYYFLPHDLRWHNTDWAHLSDIGSAVFVDRSRLMNLTRRHNWISHSRNTRYVRYLVNRQMRVSDLG